MSAPSHDRFRTRLSLLVVATVVFSVVGGGVTYGALGDEERAVVSVGVGTYGPTAVGSGDDGAVQSDDDWSESESAENDTNASVGPVTAEPSTGTETPTERETATEAVPTASPRPPSTVTSTAEETTTTDVPTEEPSETPTSEPMTAGDVTPTPTPAPTSEPTTADPTEAAPTEDGE